MEISIICPFYNAEKYLRRCIESVLAQSFGDFEFILVDDGSMDDSMAVCMEYARLDSRVRILVNEKKGVSSARNKGIRESVGKHVVFIDSDDSMTVDACEELLRGGEMDLVVSPYNVILTDGKVVSHHPPEYRGDMKGFCENVGTYIEHADLRAPCSKLFCKRILVENNVFFPEEMDLGEDTYFVLQYLKCIKTICVLPRPTYNYFVQNASLSHGTFRVDFYEIHLGLNQLLRELYIQNTSMDNSKFILQYDRGAYARYLASFAYYKEAKSKKNALKAATAHERTRKAFARGQKLSGKAEKLAGFCIRRGLFSLMWFVCRGYGWFIRGKRSGDVA